ncbi:major facilitator superfamily transporter [Protomyces lactucae-debilis]|uniref:Major facilitator superfamily transporter n=1 Tax=Protomyces lactucae-debilis TaxID=2754530 RepID=A0A1Y2EVW1_PROLT|nr:major facilitator superfamily transporter [Protomyces lactucae-debilis]ORY75719.1 major facilitator superfamily transporter [Protomyces lactucae-debilis]
MLFKGHDAVQPEVAATERRPVYSTFSKRQKSFITLLVSLASIFSPISATIYVPALPTIAKDLNVSITLVNLSVTSYMIFQGLAPSLWGPLTDAIGRRPVYLLTFLIYIAACIGLACTNSFAELIIWRSLQSTGSASTIAIGAGVIADITQSGERGGYIGLYSAGALVGNALGPVLGGIFAQTIGWHGIFYFLTALAGLFWLVLLLTLPETLRNIVGNGSIRPTGNLLRRPALPFLEPPDAAPDDISPAQTAKQFDPLGPVKMMGKAEVACSLLFTALYYTVWQSSLVASATIFDKEYGLSQLNIGLSFIASGVGAITASLITGRILDYDYANEAGVAHAQMQQEAELDAYEMTRRLSQRPLRRLEYARLRRMPINSLVYIGSVLAFGWCVQAKTTVALPIIWTFFLGFTTTSIMSAYTTLIVDWYPDAGASGTAALNLARCLLGAGGTAAVQPLMNKTNTGITFTIGAGITLLCTPLYWLVIRYARSWRLSRLKQRGMRGT